MENNNNIQNSDITRFNRSLLRKTETKITTPDGKVLLEHKQENGKYAQTVQAHAVPGMVIDDKPDLQMAELRNGLFVSSQDPVADKTLLCKHGITHILNVAGLPNFFPNDFKYKNLMLYDTPEFHISGVWEECFAFISDALEGGGKVLIHCNAGVSRSVTVLLAYVMSTERIGLIQVLDELRKLRPQAKPNPGFMKELQNFESK